MVPEADLEPYDLDDTRSGLRALMALEADYSNYRDGN